MSRPSHSRTLLSITPAVVLMAFALLSGCAPSARFRIRHPIPQNAPPQYSKEIHEEVVEDDKVIDPATVLPTIVSSAVQTDVDRSTMVHEITGMLGTPYNYSGVDNSGIDCSGFTAKVFRALGKSLPHSTAEQYKAGIAVGQGKERLGDLVFFNTTGESPSHVGIYLGGGYFAHASVSSGVTISSLESSYYKTRYIATRRVKR